MWCPFSGRETHLRKPMVVVRLVSRGMPRKGLCERGPVRYRGRSNGLLLLLSRKGIQEIHP